MESLVIFRAREKSSSRGKKKRVFLCKRTARVKVKGKVVSRSFLQIERRGTFVEMEEWRKENSYKNCEVIRTQILEHVPGARDKGAKERCQERSDGEG